MFLISRLSDFLKLLLETCIYREISEHKFFNILNRLWFVARLELFVGS